MKSLRLFLLWCLAWLAWSRSEVALAYPDPLVPDASAAAGCLDPGATMYAWVTKINVDPVQIYIIDDDDDGLPNKVYCAGGVANNLNPATHATSSCTNLQTLTSISGCPFPIKVFMGDGNDDDASSTYIDCSGITDPMLFFGGGGNDQFIGTDHGDFNGGTEGDSFLAGEGPDFLCGNTAVDVRNYLYGEEDSDWCGAVRTTTCATAATTPTWSAGPSKTTRCTGTRAPTTPTACRTPTSATAAPTRISCTPGSLLRTPWRP